MPINVVCPGCKKRFAVSEKYAGKKGPCPHCKTEITIPTEEEQVVVHAPEAAGPTDSKGAAVIKPIARQDTRFNPKIAVGIGFGVLVIFVTAWIVGSSYKSKVKGKPAEIPAVFQIITALALAPPLVFAGYTFLRNDELEPYRGKELWTRVGICAVVYAVLWVVYSILPSVLGMQKGFDTVSLTYVLPAFVLAGAFTALASLELDFLTGAMHYGLYLFVTVLMRVVAQMHAF